VVDVDAVVLRKFVAKRKSVLVCLPNGLASGCTGACYHVDENNDDDSDGSSHEDESRLSRNPIW